MNSSHKRPFWRNPMPVSSSYVLQSFAGFLLCFILLCLSACSPSKAQNSDQKNGNSKAEVEAGLLKIRSIAAMNPESWIAQANHFQDSVVKPVANQVVAITEIDRQCLDQALVAGKISLADARRIFQEPKLDLPEPEKSEANTIGLEVLRMAGTEKQPGLEMIHLMSKIAYGEADLYFVQGRNYYGKVNLYHHYGLETEGFQARNGVSLAGSVHCLESGTGIWHFVNAYYTIADDRLQPALVYPQECNSNMMPEARNWHLESEILSKNPFKVQFKWEITLGHRNEEGRYFAKDSTAITFYPQAGGWQPDYGNGALSREKMAAFSVFSSDSLFIHAWSQELEAALMGKNKSQKRMVLDLLAEMHDLED